MASINRVVISGNLTKDAEKRETSSGLAVLSFSVAVNERRKKGDEWEDYANFVDCVLFGTRADGLSKILKKGNRVCVEGHLRYSKWETEEGQKRSKLEVIVDEIVLFSSADKSKASEAGVYDDEIPF